MGELVAFKKQRRTRVRRPAVEPPAPSNPLIPERGVRWGWTLSLWVNVGLGFMAAAREDLLWMVLHFAFAYWTTQVRRQNDRIHGGKNW